MKTVNKILLTICSILLILIVTIAVCDALVSYRAKGKLYDDVAEVPHYHAGMVLGTSPYSIRNGRRNYYFDYRIQTAADLYKAGKVDILIVSGGDYRNESGYRGLGGFDEPAAMRDSLIKQGVDSAAIILDYDGIRTIKSIANARDVYGLDSVLLISQKYHNERALFQAKHLGVKAQAFNAPTPTRRSSLLWNRGRECLARVKLFLELLTEKEICDEQHPLAYLQQKLSDFVEESKADIGIAVCIGGYEPISVNGNRLYEMNSVMKLFQAYAVWDYLESERIDPSTIVSVKPKEWHHDTWSPMLNDFDTSCPQEISVLSLLEYSLQQSDNNACDLLFKKVLPIHKVNKKVSSVSIEWTEGEMHDNPDKSKDNVCTPLAAAEFMYSLFNESDKESLKKLQNILYGCATGSNRLPKPLKGTKAKIAHKTGTGFPNKQGNPRSMADVGYITLPNGICYSIAVFIASTPYDLPTNESLIAKISEITYNYLKEKK